MLKKSHTIILVLYFFIGDHLFHNTKKVCFLIITSFTLNSGCIKGTEIKEIQTYQLVVDSSLFAALEKRHRLNLTKLKPLNEKLLTAPHL